MRPYTISKGFVSTKPSMTVPGQTVDLETLLKRAASGIVTLKSNGLEYTGEDDPVIIKDYSDIDALRDEYNRSVGNVNKALKDAKEKRAKAEAIAEAKKLLEEEAKANEKTEPAPQAK